MIPQRNIDTTELLEAEIQHRRMAQEWRISRPFRRVRGKPFLEESGNILLHDPLEPSGIAHHCVYIPVYCVQCTCMLLGEFYGCEFIYRYFYCLFLVFELFTFLKPYRGNYVVLAVNRCVLVQSKIPTPQKRTHLGQTNRCNTSNSLP